MLMKETNHKFKTVIFMYKPSKEEVKKYKEKGWRLWYMSKKKGLVPL